MRAEHDPAAGFAHGRLPSSLNTVSLLNKHCAPLWRTRAAARAGSEDKTPEPVGPGFRHIGQISGASRLPSLTSN
ncbi:hypothetical protein GCM10010198_04410 [Nocardia seriolae]|nr:hypothetical protein NSERKGN1266_21500 [Nocardia seriolae]BEK97868.1 hypothetical protein NSER024013_57740 [Nocardia seriolae]